MSYFPMFIDLKDKNIVVIGGGNIAYHKVKILLDFVMNITVIAPKVNDTIKKLNIETVEREFQESDLDNRDIVVIATNDKAFNHTVATLCKERKILVNTVDQKEDCTFIFPSYIKEKNVIAAFSSGGNSPVLTQYLKEKNKEIITKDLGNLNETFGILREQVKKELNYEQRKDFYKEILERFLQNEPFDINTIIEKYKEQ